MYMIRSDSAQWRPTWLWFRVSTPLTLDKYFKIRSDLRRNVNLENMLKGKLDIHFGSAADSAAEVAVLLNGAL